MDREVAINRILRDLKMRDLISRDTAGQLRDGEVRVFLNILSVAVMEGTAKKMQAHHLRKIVQYSLDGIKLGEYNSIEEAARAVGYKGKYGRNIIGNSLSGRYKQTKKGHIWKYAEK